MSRYFVTDGPVAVYEFDPTEVISDTPPNVIWIRAKMDVETDGKVKSELITLGADGKTAEAHLGAAVGAQLVHNIVRWEGPDFDGVPCTPEHIRKLDPTEPHIEKVIEAITERNRRRESPIPKSRTASGSMSAGFTGSNTPPSEAPNLSAQLATSTSKSPLRSALDGRLGKLEN